MKIIFHPLFIAVLGFCALFGFWLFALAMLSAVIMHEFSHAAAASYFGASAKELRLLPFGAEVSIECEFLTAKQKNLVLLAGSFGNIVVVLVTGGLLWILPQWFVALEYIIFANMIPAVLNLLPIYPLDGGKVLYILAQEADEKRRGENRGSLNINNNRAETLVKTLTVLSSAFFLGLFIFCCLGFFNLPLIIMCVIMLLSINFEQKHTRFVSRFSAGQSKSKRKVAEVAVTADMSLLQAYKLVSARHFTKFVLIDAGNKFFYENDLEKMLVTNSFDTPIRKVL